MKIYEKKSLSISNELFYFPAFFVSPKDLRIKPFTEVLQVLQVLTDTFKLVCFNSYTVESSFVLSSRGCHCLRPCRKLVTYLHL